DYDEKDRAVLSTHADQVGQVSLDFSTPGETRVTDSQGKVSTYTTEIRDGIALVTAIQGPGCSSCGRGDVSYRYNAQLQLIELATKDGITKHYDYDEQGRTTFVTREMAGQPPQTLARYEYANDIDLKPSAVIRPSINPQGEHRFTNVYNALGQLIRITESGYRPETDGHFTLIRRSTELEYNAAGNLIAIDGPREDVEDKIQFRYDTKQRLSTIALADETTQKVLAYDDYDRPIKIQNGNQTPLTIRYSRWGKPQQIRQGQRTVSYTYDVVGQLVSVTEPDGEKLNFDYDAAGRAISLRDAEGNSVRKLIDTEDRLLAYSVVGSQDDVLRAAIYLRDANQRLRGVVTPEGIQRMVGYDENGKKTLDTNGGGKGSYFMRSKTGALKTVTDAEGGELRKARLANGRITLTQDSLKRIDVMMHDDFGNRTMWRNPDSGLTYYRYDQAGNLVEKRDAAGNTTSYEYDASDRLIRLESTDGITRLRYQAGLLAEVEGPESRQRYSYDNEGRLVSHSREIDGYRFTTSYTYDPKTGKLISRQLPGGERLSYRYQANQGRLSAVIQSDWLSDQPLLEGVTYEPFGRITGYTHADGGRTEKAYDKSGRLIRQDHTRLGKYKLAYNVAGELILIEKDQQHNRYLYDAAGRLSQADTSTGKKQYRYDALGNRLNQPSGSLKQVSAQASASTASNETIKDRLGRVSVLGQRRWEYNVAGQPVRFYRGERLVAAYRYNHKGERIHKTVYPDDPAQAPEITYYLYDLQQRLSAEADEDGDIIRQYLYIGRIPYAMLEDGVAYSIQSDHLGAPHSVTDDNSRLKWQAEYDPFGRAVIKTQRIGFNLRRPGQYEDAESGLYDNYLRRYDPDNGRYLEPDPLGNLDGMNRYAYVGNRPMDKIDPLGLFKVAASTGGYPVHEAILQIAFDRFNQEYAAEHGGQVAFSQHTINLFMYANIRTDLIMDSEHQYLFQNHFDNPTDGPLNDGDAEWFSDALATINSRRQEYGNISGELRVDVCAPPGNEPIRQNPNIIDIVENFGANTHTLADFYAHSNWVDEATRGGYYILEREIDSFGTREVIEEGTVPHGLAMTSIWDEQVEGYDLYSGQVDGLIDIFGSPFSGERMDIFGNVDKSTHAYWEKDAPPSDEESAEFRRFEMARNLAIEHTLQEIRRLWEESENNMQLRVIYSMNSEEKGTESVQYSLEGCVLCPGFGDFEDIDSQIDYVAEFINDQNW
ncbi:MAG: RHS repeat-associated core domain-containing protein, partial [Candidatus Thiodiazotropha endolucinida]